MTNPIHGWWRWWGQKGVPTPEIELICPISWVVAVVGRREPPTPEIEPLADTLDFAGAGDGRGQKGVTNPRNRGEACSLLAGGGGRREPCCIRHVGSMSHMFCNGS